MVKITNNTTRRQAFTLIEMLTIVVIIGLLLGIAMPSLIKVRLQFMRSASLATLRTISGACEMYKIDFDEFPPSNNTGYPYLPAWQGRELLPLLLIGYGNDTDTKGHPMEGGATMDADDGKDGFGYRMSIRGQVFGPYNGTEEAELKDSDNGRPVFVDSFDNEIYYYRFNGTQYVTADNANPSADDPPNINNYTKDDGGNYFTRDFVLCTKGPDREWMTTIQANPDTDDITNFLRE